MLSFLYKQTDLTKGILWMISAAFWFAAMTIMVAYVANMMHPFQIALFRNVFACMMFIPGILWFGIGHIRTKYVKGHWLRALSGVVGMLMWFYALTITPANEVVALSFVVPIITTLMAVFFLKEVVGWQRWVAMLIGFGGVMVILRPGGDVVGLGGLLVLGATITWSISNILIKHLSGSESPRVIAFYLTLFMIPLCLPFALAFWSPISAEALLWLIAIGFTGNLAQFSLASSYSKADISDVLPFDFARLIFISIFSYVLFGQIIDFWTIAGALIIFSSAFYIVKRQAYERKELVRNAKATPADEAGPL